MAVSDPLSSESEAAFIARLAERVVARGLTVPAILMLESCKPLNVVAAQGLLALEPLVRLLAPGSDVRRLVALLERRDSLEQLLLAIEACEANSPAVSRPGTAQVGLSRGESAPPPPGGASPAPAAGCGGQQP